MECLEVVLKALKTLLEDELPAKIDEVEAQWAATQEICEDWALAADAITMDDICEYVISGTDLIPVEGRFPRIYIFGWEISPENEFEQEFTGRYNLALALRLIVSGDDHERLEKVTMRYMQAIMKVLKDDDQIKQTVYPISIPRISFTEVTPGDPMFKAAQMTFFGATVDPY